MTEFDPSLMSGTLDTSEIGGAGDQKLNNVAPVFDPDHWNDSRGAGIADAEQEFHKRRQ